MSSESKRSETIEKKVDAKISYMKNLGDRNDRVAVITGFKRVHTSRRLEFVPNEIGPSEHVWQVEENKAGRDE